MIHKITLMVGLNDKDTMLQEVNTLDAYKMVGRAIDRDCTITEGCGIYTHQNGEVIFEKSLVVQILDFDGSLDDEWVKNKVEQIKQLLNQESVAVQHEQIDSKLI